MTEDEFQDGLDYGCGWDIAGPMLEAVFFDMLADSDLPGDVEARLETFDDLARGFARWREAMQQTFDLGCMMQTFDVVRSRAPAITLDEALETCRARPGASVDDIDIRRQRVINLIMDRMRREWTMSLKATIL